MKSENLLNELSARTGIKNIIWMFLALSVLTNCLLALVLATKGTIVQNTLTPPEIRKTMSVSNVAFSKEYLEEMAPYMAYLLLNSTPQTVDYQNSKLLFYTDYQYKDALEKELKVNAIWLKRHNASTHFTPVSAAADTNDNTVNLKGKFEVKKSNRIVETRDREFLIKFKNNNGTIVLIGIDEIFSQKQKENPLNAPETKELIEETVTITNTVSDFKGGSNE